MADYRVYIRSSNIPFDGVTPEDAVYAGQGHKFTTQDLSPVGLWFPASLGRFNTVSLVKIFSDNIANPGDLVNILSSLNVLRYSAPYTPAGTIWLWMEPDDILQIISATSTKCEIVCNDICNQDIIQIPNILPDECECCEFEQVEVNSSPFAVIPWSFGSETCGEELVIFTNFTPTEATLPDSTTVKNSSKIVMIKSAGTGPVTIVPFAGDLINTFGDANYVPYTLNDFQNSVTYRKIPGGWQRDEGTGVDIAAFAAVDPYNIDPSPQGTQYVYDSIGVDGGIINLPDLTKTRAGFRVVIFNDTFLDHIVAPFAGQAILNGNFTFNLPPRSVAIFENPNQSIPALGIPYWDVISQDLSPPLITTSLDINLQPFFGGQQRVKIIDTIEVIEVTLPDTALLVKGSSVLIENGGDFRVRIFTFIPGVDLINQNTSLNNEIPPKYSAEYIYMGQLAGGANWSSLENTVGNALQIRNVNFNINFVSSTQAAYRLNPGVAEVTLPNLNNVGIGDCVSLFNFTGGPVTINVDAGDIINSQAVSLGLPDTNNAIIFKSAVDNWTGIISA